MRFWWVNQNQTYAQEVGGGYLWSPRRKSNGDSNPFYDFMREVAPGDVIFSFAGTWIRAIGIARSFAHEAAKPMEFGQTGAHWEQIGWRVDVNFHKLQDAIRPSEHMALLSPLLPTKYSPLRPNGSGLQSVYLTRVDERMACMLIDLIGTEARLLVNASHAQEGVPEIAAVGLIQLEEHAIAEVRDDRHMDSTEKESIVIARRGQGLFKQRVMRLERGCRVTGVTEETHLRASHCKPWRDSSNEERLDGENGLLLTPNVDHLFDRGFLSFENNGDLLVASRADENSLRRMGIDAGVRLNVGQFSSGQKRYLEYHRENVLLKSRFLPD